MFNVTAQRQRASTDATHFALGFATAVRDHLVATRAARASCSTHSSAGLVVVVAGAEQVPAEGLEMVLRPLHAAAEGTTVGVGSFDDGSQDSRGGPSHVLGHILGTEVLLPPATTVVLLFHVPDVSFSAYQGRSGGGSGGGSGDAGGGGGDLDLVAAQEELRRALAPSVRRVLFRHSSVTLVPLVEQAPQWEASAVDCLRARQHQSHHNQHPLPPPPQQQQRPAHGGAHQHASLSRRFSGQPHAVEAVVRALSARDDGYDENGADGSPLVLALLGPSGTGKTEFARELASSLHGGASAESLEASGHLVRFAMNQYTTQASLTNLLGADKGNVGQCQGALTNALRRKVQPHEDGGQGQGQGSIVVVLDEFEKAHASFADACFLNAFGAHGFLTDSCADNERVSTARATFIITSNFAAEELLLPDHALQLNPNQEDGGASTKGANSNSSLQKMKMKTKAAAYDAAVREATQRATSARESWQQDPQGRRNPFFRAEARGRVDAFVPFFPLTLEQRRVVAFSLLHKALATVELRFNQRHNSDNSDNSDNNNNNNNNRSSGGGDSSGSGSGSEAGKGSNSLSVAPKLRLAWTPAVTSRLAGQYSSLEGLRPMVTALTELSAVLRKERERGRFDPSASGKVVALIDVDEDDEDDGEDDNDDGGGGVDGDGDDGDDGQRGGGRDGGGDGGRGQSGGYLGGVGKLVVRSLALSPEAFREVGFLEARGRGEEEEAAGTEPHIGGGVTREEEEEEEEEEENGKQQDFMALSHPPRHHEQQQEQQQQQWQEQEHTRSQLEETNHDDEDAATVSASSIHQDAETSTHRDKNEQVDSDQARAAVAAAAAVLVLRVAAFAALLLLSLFAAKALLSVLCAQAAAAAWVALAASGAMLAAACAVLSWAWFRFVPRWARDLAWGAAVKGFAFAWARPGTAGLFVGSALFFLPPLWGRFFWPHFTRFFLHPSSSSSSSSSRTRTQEGEEEEEEKKDSTRISNNSSRSSIDSSNSRLQRQNALLALTLKERDEAKQRVLQVEKLLSSAESRCSALTSELAELKKEKRRTPLGSGQQSSFLPTCLGGEEEGSGKLEESAQEENGDVRNEL